MKVLYPKLLKNKRKKSKKNEKKKKRKKRKKNNKEHDDGKLIKEDLDCLQYWLMVLVKLL